MSQQDKPAYWMRQKHILAITGLPSTEKLLLLALNYYLADNPEAWPAQKALAVNACVTERYVRTLVDNLASRGLISVRRAKPNRYRLNWNRIIESGSPVPDSDLTNRKLSSGTNRKSATPNRKSSSGKSGTPVPTNTQEHPENTQKNTQDGVASLKPFSWKIMLDELKDHSQIEKRFQQAVRNGWLAAPDRLRFHTLAVYIRRQANVDNLGALMTSLLRKGRWAGTNADEDAARDAIRSLTKPKAKSNFAMLASKMAAAIPEGGDDEPIC